MRVALRHVTQPGSTLSSVSNPLANKLEKVCSIKFKGRMHVFTQPYFKEDPEISSAVVRSYENADMIASVAEGMRGIADSIGCQRP
jgi:hypothetical protein